MIARFDEAKYAQVLGKYKPRPIHDDEANLRAIKMLEGLYELDVLTPEQEALGELLATLIEKYEEERYALKEASPGVILRELLESNDMERKDLSKLIGSRGIASEILSGKRRISRTIAQIYASRFNVSYRLFL
jgi:HTH-type transcriptional regulator / antitoxin HigA